MEKSEKAKSVDILILHGMDNDLVEDIKSFLTSLELTSSTVLNLSSLGKPQYERVNYQIKNCGLPLVILTFDEEDKLTEKGRLNVYDEITRCLTFRPKDLIVLREVEEKRKVKLQSNVEGKLVILEFDRAKLHKLFPQLIIEFKGRGIIKPKESSEFVEKFSLGNTLNKFLDQMDEIWTAQFDKASEEIVRNDWHTENKFQITLDKFFIEYWKVFDALIRQKKANGELKAVSDQALASSLTYASEVWESVADAKMKTVEEIRNKRSKDKKFDNQLFEKYFNQADKEIRNARRRHTTTQHKIQALRNAIDILNTLIRKIGH